MASESSLAVAATKSPYQLDKSQVLKGTSALLRHIKSEGKRKASAAGKKNLLSANDGDDESDDSSSAFEPIYLTVSTKRHIVDKKRLKPSKIELPHSLNRPGTSICLLTADPQATFKEVVSHPSFPQALASRIRILGIQKIKTRYKSFESRRQLVAQYDVFLADDRIVCLLPRLLGSIMYGTTAKRPIPVNLIGSRPRDKTINKAKQTNDLGPKSQTASPAAMAKELEKALSSAQVYLSPSVTTSIRVGYSNFTPKEIADNIATAASKMIDKIIPQGWKNLRSLHVKGPNSSALPLWQADQLWVEDEDVLDDEQAREAKLLASQKGKKRKGKESGSATDDSKAKKIKGLGEAGFSKEMAERRELLRQQKNEAMDHAESAEEPKKLEAAKPSDEKKVKIKVKKTVTVSAAV